MADQDYYDDGDEYEQQDGAGTSRASTPSDGTQPSKKVRKNHNEFERRRRDAQRQRLEELRQAIPGLDSKASMVAVLTSAREYIEQLRARNALLDHGRAASPAAPSLPPRGPPEIVVSSKTSSLNPLAKSIQPRIKMPELTRKISSESDDGPATDGDKFFRKGRAKLVDALQTHEPASPVVATHHQPHAHHVPHQHAPTPPVYYHDPSQYPNTARPSLLSAVLQDTFHQGQRPRKDSGLLLPTEDPHTFYFGHRDSMQTLMALPMPMIVDVNSQSYVQCLKCHRGVEGLVMIDCDRCRKWYHIRCVGIDSTSIPVNWTCPECPQSPILSPTLSS